MPFQRGIAMIFASLYFIVQKLFLCCHAIHHHRHQQKIRLEVLSSLLGDIKQNWDRDSSKVNQTRPDATTRPEIIAPYLHQLV